MEGWDTFPDIVYEKSLKPGSKSLLHNWDLLLKNVGKVVIYHSALQNSVRSKAQGLQEVEIAQTEREGPLPD